MSDAQGSTPQVRRTVALPTVQERWRFVAQYTQDHPGILAGDVEEILDEARARIVPSDSREKLTAQVEKLLRLG